MKKIWFVPLLAIPIAAVAYFSRGHSDTPTYVQDAQERVSSYLSYSYGPTTCSSDKKNARGWALECQVMASKKDLKYSVYPANEAPKGTPRSFFIVAENQDAKLSAKADLMVYLDITNRSS